MASLYYSQCFQIGGNSCLVSEHVNVEMFSFVRMASKAAIDKQRRKIMDNYHKT